MNHFEKLKLISNGINLNITENDIFKFAKPEDIKFYLEGNTIGFNSIENFNDPFESAYSYNHWLKSKGESLVSAINYGEEYDIKISRIRATIKKRLNNVSISCFSLNPYEPLMWAHYSKNHNGVCLCFDRRTLFKGQNTNYRKVRYSNQLPTIDFFEGVSSLSMLQPQIDEIIFTKSINWAYEEEFRIYEKNKIQALEFNPVSLKYIIMGCRFSEEKELQTLVDQFNKKHSLDVRLLYSNNSLKEFKMLFFEDKPPKLSRYSLPWLDSNDDPII